MKYMMLMQFSGQPQDEIPPIHTWPVEDVKAHIEFMHDTNRKLIEAGEFVDAQGLAAPDQARIVRAGEGGAAVVTDGPFPETKEFLIGYWIIDCDGPERAVDLAAYVSAAPGPGGKPLNMPIEVREVMSAAPPEKL
ncbi:YciI family protein [Streptosporangium sp. NBC_01755]|uniref:YciI family protein n=1 Tax=unclassified Streptosporangium TaxID=2632669 RepID=UPI002DDB3496|nr:MULTISPECIES: YciI family protein [unclassified Streptosporangium]WSA24713.1 YciI family protein [Streptosporangium sp. NBC_01810]WSC97210.1 YciI family protein [Streptosporangium sp. NBC_01755]